MSENVKQTDPDIVEMDFPPYAEEQSHFPEVDTDLLYSRYSEQITKYLNLKVHCHGDKRQ